MNTTRHSGGTRLKAARALICCAAAFTVIVAGCAKKPAVETAGGVETPRLETDIAKESLVRALDAIGGLENARGWKTRIEKGLLKVDWPGWGHMQADCNRFVKKPDKLKIDRDFSVYNHPFFQNYYYNGGEGWYMVNLNTRQSPQLTARLREFVERVDDIAYFVTQCDSFFRVPDAPGDSLLSSDAFERIGCIHDGDTVLYDLDRHTHLPLRRTENGGAQQSIFEDYRQTGKLKFPFRVIGIENGRMTSEYIWNKVLFNEEIDDAIFEEYRPPVTTEGGR